MDFLSGKYGGDGENVSKHVDGIKTLPATGGNFAFEFPPTDVLIKYTRSDGALDNGHVNVISVVPYLVMKAAALGRGKPKDAYDIYCTINNYKGGVRELASEFEPYADKELVPAICRAVHIPVVAIGGITGQNLPELAGSGIAGPAVVSALFAQPNPAAAAKRLRALSDALFG